MAPVLLERISLLGMRDPVSALTHGLGAVMGLVATVLLLIRTHRSGASARSRARVLLYGLSLVAAFSASFLFHFFDRPPEDIVLYKKMDHAAIFLLIASTTAAIIGLVDRPWTSWLIRGTWTIALIALVVKVTIWPMPLWISAAIYLVVGWLGLIGLMLLARTVGWKLLRPVVHGSLILTLAAFFFVTERPVVLEGVVEGHEVFHIAVLAGVAIHYAFIFRHCGGSLCGRDEMTDEDTSSVHPGIFRKIG